MLARRAKCSGGLPHSDAAAGGGSTKETKPAAVEAINNGKAARTAGTKKKRQPCTIAP
jgi:hypothetical protein